MRMRRPALWIVLVAAGYALLRVYLKALDDEVDGDLVWTWEGFLIVWIPAAVVIGLGITYLWPWARERWARRRDPR